MKRISFLFLALALTGAVAFAEDCVTGCGSTEPCDGYCVDQGRYEDCSDGITVILQYCHPFYPGQAPAFWSPAAAVARCSQPVSPADSWLRTPGAPVS